MGRLQDEFEPLGTLGTGGHGTVTAARHRTSGRAVAIKSLLERVVDDGTTRERFLRECRIQVQSPHVVRVHEVCIEAGVVYLIMEYVDGPSLEALVARGPLPIADALRIAYQVALGLAAAHALGVVHRDVKPANVLLTRAGTAKLTDFGIAKALDPDGRPRLTATGHGMGTLAYVSPEQAENAKHVDARADVYSLGATLYHLLAGRPPFVADTQADLLVELFEEDPPPLSALRPDCPQQVAELVHLMLEKDPDERPPSAQAVAEALRCWLAGR